MLQLQLTTQQIDEITKLSKKIIYDEFVLHAYGSRTNGEARNYSDLNIIVKAKQKIDFAELCALKDAFEFSDLPFRVDIQDWYGMSESFKENIQSFFIELN